MDAPPPFFLDRPSRAALKRGLRAVLAAEVAAHGPMRIVNRRENPLVSSYVADIVHLRFADGHRARLLCKFAHGRDLTVPTPHLGLAHEARVYAEVLDPCPLETPRVRGGFVDDETGDFVLVMDFYPDAVAAGKSADPDTLHALVRWLAGFHAWAAERLDDPRWTFLPRYDAALHEMWLERTLAHAAPIAADHPWLPRAAAAYRERIDLLVSAPRTVVHGEFTPLNALWDRGRILPIDWETAAVAPAEVDLAVLTYDWDLGTIAALERTYVEARWRGTPPPGHAETLLAARIYAAFHWLFGTPAGISAERIAHHLATLHAEAVRWGFA